MLGQHGIRLPGARYSRYPALEIANLESIFDGQSHAVCVHAPAIGWVLNVGFWSCVTSIAGPHGGAYPPA
jgi:hypothetical protein